MVDLVKNAGENLLPVGRLDMYTSGALILTNDGDFIYHVTHPKHEVEKTYTVTLRGKVTKLLYPLNITMDCYTVIRVDKHPKMWYNRKKKE